MKTIGLLDCNSFYASCERVFNPLAMVRPVVVLSNNDGIVVALTADAKKIGIKRGAPLFKIQDLVAKYNVMVFSSNYELYGDMSSRIFQIVQDYVPDLEIYSIDEGFINYYDVHDDVTEINLKLRNLVKQCTGVPVSIGLAPTKTLAKVANKFAKKYTKLNGVLDITHKNLEQVLTLVEVSDIWGIGRRYAQKLYRNGIYNAWQLSQAKDSWVQKQLTINGLRTVMELRGIPCSGIEKEIPPKKSIVSSRTFGSPISTKHDMKEALASYLANAIGKLRKQNSATRMVYLYTREKTHFQTQSRYNSVNIILPYHTSLLSEILPFVDKKLDRLFKEGVIYSKAGVMLNDLIPFNHLQTSLFNNMNNEKLQTVAVAMDSLNKKYKKKNTVVLASQGLKHDWDMKRENQSPCYTTKWADILKVN